MALQMIHQARLHAIVWQVTSRLFAYCLEMPTDTSVTSDATVQLVAFHGSCLELDMQSRWPPTCKAAHLQEVAELLTPSVLQVVVMLEPLKHVLHAPTKIACRWALHKLILHRGYY